MNMPIANLRTQIQAGRIEQGVQSGELTLREAKSLRADQREIRGAIQDAKSDGSVTLGERRDIRQMQNEASRDIFQAKHDGDKRGTPRGDVREARQQHRIQDGVQDGSVTRAEAVGLRATQRAIHHAEAQFKSDGQVTGAERAKLEALQDYASKQIYAAKHNSMNRA